METSGAVPRGGCAQSVWSKRLPSHSQLRGDRRPIRAPHTLHVKALVASSCSILLFLAHDVSDLFQPLTLPWHSSYISSREPPWATFPGADEETLQVNRVLDAHQNPSDCNDRKYFIWAPPSSGMGSGIHVSGLVLGLALEHNRTLLYDPHESWVHTSPDTCGKALTPDCFYESLSRCQYMAENAKEVAEFGAGTWEDAQFVEIRSGLGKYQAFTPTLLTGPKWPSRDLPWWRAQTTRYILRPTKELMTWTEGFFAQSLHRRPFLEGWNSTTCPPPRDAICIHVRHGDKASEMPLHDIEEYLQTAEDLVDNGASLNVFLTTDDEGIINDVENETISAKTTKNFTFYYTRYNRGAVDYDRAHYARPLLANLFLSVHPSCQWFVQTTGSNICRMINEIRKTDGVRGEATWIDLEGGEWRA